MNEQNLLIICLNAFAAVLVLLSLLALCMRALSAVFPAAAQPGSADVRPTGAGAGAGDPALAAAIAMTARALFPGAQLTRIEPVAPTADDSRKDSA